MQSLLHSELVRTFASDKARQPAIQTRRISRRRWRLPVAAPRPIRRRQVARGRV